MEEESSRNQELLTLAALKKEYHLSPKWIERLGPPDEEKPNPHYRSAAPMKLWRKERVEIFLQQHEQEYLEDLNRWEQRSRGAKDVAARKAEETLEYARSVDIRLYTFPKDLQKACLMHLVELSVVYGWYEMPDVTETTIVNMLRHRYSNYEFLLNSLFGRIGRWEAYPIIKDRVNRAVCERAGIPLTAAITRDSDDEFVEKRWEETRDGDGS